MSEADFKASTRAAPRMDLQGQFGGYRAVRPCPRHRTGAGATWRWILEDMPGRETAQLAGFQAGFRCWTMYMKHGGPAFTCFSCVAAKKIEEGYRQGLPQWLPVIHENVHCRAGNIMRCSRGAPLVRVVPLDPGGKTLREHQLGVHIRRGGAQLPHLP
eukprot:1242611-Rhodomonas_salina.1